MKMLEWAKHNDNSHSLAEYIRTLNGEREQLRPLIVPATELSE